MAERWTAERLVALPEGPLFGAEERMIDGVMHRVPVLEKQPVAYFVGDEDVISCVDEDGNRWRLGRYNDGTWFKQRC